MSDQYYCVKCKKKTEMRDPERVTTQTSLDFTGATLV
ncbi:MAG: DUF5679 domain-containing protein [Ktedonobacteraceae bacterium]